jgi:acyl-CoA thioester hydrolase
MRADQKPLLQTFNWPVRVYWEDTDAGVVFVVRRVEADYLMPAQFNDRLNVRCELAELGGASLSMHQQVLRDEHLLLQARVKIVCVQQSSFRPVRMPDIVSQAFGALI